jgi:hypothetical protein
MRISGAKGFEHEERLAERAGPLGSTLEGLVVMGAPRGGHPIEDEVSLRAYDAAVRRADAGGGDAASGGLEAVRHGQGET